MMMGSDGPVLAAIRAHWRRWWPHHVQSRHEVIELIEQLLDAGDKFVASVRSVSNSTEAIHLFELMVNGSVALARHLASSSSQLLFITTRANNLEQLSSAVSMQREGGDKCVLCGIRVCSNNTPIEQAGWG